ncbi:hypothetical protein Bca4012_051128 [Brassica carinata]
MCGSSRCHGCSPPLRSSQVNSSGFVALEVSCGSVLEAGNGSRLRFLNLCLSFLVSLFAGDDLLFSEVESRTSFVALPFTLVNRFWKSHVSGFFSP